MIMMHYLNNAGASLLSESTLATIQEHLILEQAIGPYSAAELRQGEMETFYKRAAVFLNAEHESTIFYHDSASRGWNVLLNSLQIERGQRIVTFSSEFGTNLVTLYDLAKRTGATLTIINCALDGTFLWSELERAVEGGVSLVCVSHAAAHGSIVNPVVEIGALLRDIRDCTYVVDGCQAAGQLIVDVAAIGCHAYICTGRKWLRGPRGTAFSYVKKGARFRSTHFDLANADISLNSLGFPAHLTLTTSARQFELWERSVAMMLGLSMALKEAAQVQSRGVMASVRECAGRLRAAVTSGASLELVGALESQSCTVGFTCKDASLEPFLKESLIAEQINFSSMGDWDCPLHFPRKGASTIFRLSPHYFTPPESIDAALKVLRSLP